MIVLLIGLVLFVSGFLVIAASPVAGIVVSLIGAALVGGIVYWYEWITDKRAEEHNLWVSHNRQKSGSL